MPNYETINQKTRPDLVEKGVTLLSEKLGLTPKRQQELDKGLRRYAKELGEKYLSELTVVKK